MMGVTPSHRKKVPVSDANARRESVRPLPLPVSLWRDLGVIALPVIALSLAGLVLPFDLAIARAVLDRKAAIGTIGYDLSLISYAVAAVVLIAMSVPAVRSRWPLFVRCGAVFVMTMIIAVLGFVQNTKRELDRPRPYEVKDLGGRYAFAPPFGSDPACDQCTSFPSSAAGSAFLLCTPYFVLRRRHRRVALGFLATGLVWGSLVGYARMVPGLHWFSDIVWSGALVLMVASVLAHLSVGWWVDRGATGGESPPD